MIIAQSHVPLLEEMHKLHAHLIDRLTAQSKHIETISIDLLAFKMDMERLHLFPWSLLDYKG